jgi:hypothetical protein
MALPRFYNQRYMWSVMRRFAIRNSGCDQPRRLNNRVNNGASEIVIHN